MIYNIALLKAGLFGVVGFQEPLDTNSQGILDAPLKVSSSGVYFQDVHELLRIEYIRSICNEEVSNDNTKFNTYLTRSIEASINNMLWYMYNKKKPEVSALLDNYVLFDRANSFENTIDNVANTFVGYKIDLSKSNNIKASIEQIGTQFDSSEAMTVYLYHTSQKAALKTETITTDVSDQKLTTLSDWAMEYVMVNGYGGSFIIGYNQTGKTAKAINRSWSDSAHKKISAWFDICPIIVKDYTGAEIPNIEDIISTSDTYGLNFKIKVESDLTQFFIDNKNEFAKAISMQFAFDMLWKIYYSNRNNEDKRFNGQALLIELKGTDENKEIGLEYKLKKTIEELNFDFSQLDNRLLPPNDAFSFTDL